MSTSPKRSLKRTCAGVSAGALALTGFAAGFAAAATSASATQSFTFSRLAGSDRFGTAAAIATNTFPGGAATVLIANGDTGHFPDALSGNYLAGQDGAPILLTHVDTLPTATSDALTALKAKNVVILGQTSAVGSTVEADLKAKGYSVTRVGGVDRYATARDISESKGATAVGSVGSSGPTALLASGQNFPDALVAGPLGYAGKFPVEITDPNTLSSATQTALQDLKIKNVIIAGGDTAVSQGVENQVKGLNGGITITRLSGVSRTETATTIADYAVKNLGFSNKHVNLARSDDFPDALTGGPHAGAEKSPIILANDPNTLGTAAANWLKANSGTLTDGHIFGGTSAVSNAVQSEATKDAQGTSGATVSSSNSTIAPGGTATISVKGAQPNTALTFSVPANCGTVSPTNPTTDASGNTSSVFTASSTASGSCTITVKDAAGNTVGTSTVTVTPASSNQAINVQPQSAATQTNGTSRTFTATGLDNTKTYAIQLFGCTTVQNSTGNATFTQTVPPNSTTGAPGSGQAQGGTAAKPTSSSISSVNGTNQAAGNQQNLGVSPQNGTITFAVTGPTDVTSPSSCVEPVVFQDVNNNGVLDTNQTGGPTEPYGVGGQTTFNPAAANAQSNLGGSNGLFVSSLDNAAGTFVGCTSENRNVPYGTPTTNGPVGSPGNPAGGTQPNGAFGGPCYTFTYGNPGDSYGVVPYSTGGSGQSFFGNGAATNQAAFAKAITTYDQVFVNYGNNIGSNYSEIYSPGGPNGFEVNDTDPIAPDNNTVNKNVATPPGSATPTSARTTATIGARDPKTGVAAPYNTVTITFNDSDTPTAQSYNIYRSTAGTNAAGKPQSGTDSSGNPVACAGYPNTTPAQPAPGAGTPSTAYTKVGTLADQDPSVGANGGQGTAAPTTNGSTYTFQDQNLSANTTYCYVVSVVQAGDEHFANGTAAGSNSGAPVQADVTTATAPVTPPKMQYVTITGSSAPTSTTNASGAATANVVYNQAVTCAANAGPDFSYSNSGGTPANSPVKGQTCQPGTPTTTFSNSSTFVAGSTDTLNVTFATAAQGGPAGVASPATGDTFTYTAPGTPTTQNAVYTLDVNNNNTPVYAPTQTLTATSSHAGPGSPTNPVGTAPGGPAVGSATTPMFTTATSTNATSTITVNYNTAIDCTSVDTDASDYSVAYTGGPAAAPSGNLPVASATCSAGTAGAPAGTPGSTGSVTITFTGGPVQSGENVTVTAKAGATDGNTVKNPVAPNPQQPVGDTVTAKVA